MSKLFSPTKSNFRIVSYYDMPTPPWMKPKVIPPVRPPSTSRPALLLPPSSITSPRQGQCPPWMRARRLTAPTSSPPPRQHYPGSCTPPVHPTPPSGAPVVLTPPGAFSLLPAPNAHSPQRCFTPRRPIHPPTVFPSPALHPPPSAAAPRPLSKKVEAALKSIE